MARTGAVYVTVEQLGNELGYTAAQYAPGTELAGELDTVTLAASDAIDSDIGNTDPFEAGDIPPMITRVALSLAVDLVKLVDGSGGTAGTDSTGILVTGDVMARYRSLLNPYRTESGWGVA